MSRIANLTAACLIALLPLGQAGATEEQAARKVTETLVHGAYDAMAAKDVAEPARHAKLKETISAAFAFDIWERFLVGDRALTPAQLSEFRGLLPGFLAQLYSDSFGKGLEAEPEVADTRTVRRDVLVSAAIPRPNGNNLPVEYRIREFPERGPLVIDVMVGGISFLVLKRDEFRAIIDERGVEGLLAFMRENAI